MTSWRIKAPIYSLVRRLPPFSLILQQEIEQLAKLLHRVDITVDAHLDLGSGAGDSLALFPNYKKRMCVDASWAMLAQLPANPKLLARAECLPFAEHSFDLVSAIGLLEYVAEIENLWQEVRRVLKPNGYFLFTTSPSNWGNRMRRLLGERLSYLSEAEVQKLLHRNGWAIRARGRSWLQDQWLAQVKEGNGYFLQLSSSSRGLPA